MLNLFVTCVGQRKNVSPKNNLDSKLLTECITLCFTGWMYAHPLSYRELVARYIHIGHTSSSVAKEKKMKEKCLIFIISFSRA